MIPECDNPSLNDCDSPDRALCIDTDEGYLCQCRQGFFDISPQPRAKPGRLCKALENECEKGTHDCAREGGICDDTPDSYICRCAVNYLDVSFDKVNHPGRNCKVISSHMQTFKKQRKILAPYRWMFEWAKWLFSECNMYRYWGFIHLFLPCKFPWCITRFKEPPGKAMSAQGKRMFGQTPLRLFAKCQLWGYTRGLYVSLCRRFCRRKSRF